MTLIGDSERALQIMIYSKLSVDFSPLRGPDFGSFGLLIQNHVPVHRTDSAKVIQITKASKTRSPTRTENAQLYGPFSFTLTLNTNP